MAAAAWLSVAFAKQFSHGCEKINAVAFVWKAIELAEGELSSCMQSSLSTMTLEKSWFFSYVLSSKNKVQVLFAGHVVGMKIQYLRKLPEQALCIPQTPSPEAGVFSAWLVSL